MVGRGGRGRGGRGNGWGGIQVEPHRGGGGGGWLAEEEGEGIQVEPHRGDGWGDTGRTTGGMVGRGERGNGWRGG